MLVHAEIKSRRCSALRRVTVLLSNGVVRCRVVCREGKRWFVWCVGDDPRDRRGKIGDLFGVWWW